MYYSRYSSTLVELQQFVIFVQVCKYCSSGISFELQENQSFVVLRQA